MDQERRRKLLDYVPTSVKRRRYEDDPIGAARLAQVVMNMVTQPGTGEWLDNDALCGLSAPTNQVVHGARLHPQPRRRLFDHDRYKDEPSV